MHVSMNEIMDYKSCPQLYKFRYIDSLPEKKDLSDYFRECLKKTISYFYFCMIDKKEKSLNNLFQKWEQLWFSKEINENFPQNEIREGSNSAVNLIKNFYKYTCQEKIIPVAVDFRYEVTFEGDKNIHVTGKIDLIKVVDDKSRNRETDLVFFSYSSSMPDEFQSKIDLNTTMAAYAFRKNFDARESGVILCNIGKKQELVIHKTGSDFIRSQKILHNIVSGIENRIFYPSDNALNCRKCKFRSFCINEKAMEDRNAIS